MGYYPRKFEINSTFRDLVYNWHPAKDHYSMILTGAAFVSTAFIAMYNNKEDEIATRIRLYVDANMNCEDIGMNFLVSHYYPEIVPRLVITKPIEFTVKTSICSRPGHVERRSKCLNDFVKIFGKNPLQIVSL